MGEEKEIEREREFFHDVHLLGIIVNFKQPLNRSEEGGLKRMDR